MQRRTLLASLAACAAAGTAARAAAGFVTTRDNQRLAYRRSRRRQAGRVHPRLVAGIGDLDPADRLARCTGAARRRLRPARPRRSDKPADGYDFDSLAADLAAVLEQLDLQRRHAGRPFDGRRRSGALSRAPRQPAGRAHDAGGAHDAFALKTSDNPEGIDRAVYDKAGGGAREPIRKPTSPPARRASSAATRSRRWSNGACRSHWQASVPALVKCLRAFSETDFRADMRAFTVPTLIVYGTGDVPSTAKNAARVRPRRLPAAGSSPMKAMPTGCCGAFQVTSSTCYEVGDVRCKGDTIRDTSGDFRGRLARSSRFVRLLLDVDAGSQT